MDLAELGVVAKQDGVKETGDALDKLAGSATNAEDKVNKFNAESATSNAATAQMGGYVDEAAAAFARMGPLVLAAVAAVASFVAASVTIEKFVDATSEAEANQAQLAAALKSTKGVSGQTIETLNAHAEALQRLTTYEDDTINKAQSLLLTFTKISGEIFPQATEAAADLAARMGGDLQGATLQVGKALNDPIKGITALSRAGIQFTEDQKEMINSFVEANNIIGAQKIILQELETQFGGSAEAARATLGGAITALQNAFGNLFEVAGPGSENLRLAIEELVTAMDNPAFKDFANTVGTVLFAALQLAVKGFTLLVEGISAFWEYAGPTIKEFGDLLYQLGSVIIPAIGEAFQAVWSVVGPIIQYFLEGWKEVYEVLKQIIGIQEEVKAPETPAVAKTASAAANDNTVPSSTATKAAADALNKAVTTGGTNAADAMNKGVTTGGATAASAAEEASKIGAQTLANSFGEGAEAVGSSVSSGGDTAAAAIEAAGNVMAAKFEGTGRNIYDLWNNWGDQFIDAFGTSIGDLLIDFQRAQTAQLEAQAELLEAQARLTNEQYKFLRDNGAMPGTQGSGSSGGGGRETTSGFLGIDLGGNGTGRKDRRSRNTGGTFGSDLDDEEKKKRWRPLNERGNVDLPEIKIINQNNPQDSLDNLNTSKGGRTIMNVIGNNRRQARAILGIRG